MAIHTLCNFSSFGMIDLFLHLGKCNPFVKHYVHTSNQVRVVAVSLPQLTQASFLQKKSNVAKSFFDICNTEMAQSLSSLQKSEFLKLIISCF